jgi:drug/metabolite transporter (DMT)-like permease
LSAAFAPILEACLSRTTATLIGFTAVLMWAVLAALTAASGAVPPFQLAAMTFLIGGLIGIVTWPFRPHVLGALPSDWRIWALGVIGLFGYHFVYFTAIRSAPPVEVSLLAYLWPLFLVAFSAFLPGVRLKWNHIAGVVIGLLGAILVITRGQSFSLTQGFGLGHVLGFACAIIWATYSVLSRRFGKVSTDVVAGFCLITSALAFICHLLFETTVWPASPSQWLAVLGLGLLPVGAAFYTWDLGVKRGDIMALGASSYASPLLSTLVLILSGFASFHWSVIVACLLITLGAVIAAKDLLFRRIR